MVTIRCTQNLLKALNVKPVERTQPSDAKLGVCQAGGAKRRYGRSRWRSVKSEVGLNGAFSWNGWRTRPGRNVG